MTAEKFNRNLKIGIFILIVIGSFLIFPNIIKAHCAPSCYQDAGTGCGSDMSPKTECNWGVNTTNCCACGWQTSGSCDDVGDICKSGSVCFVPMSGGQPVDHWSKCNKFPDTDSYNGRPCGVVSESWGICGFHGQGVWDASERKCVQCNGKVEKKICGSAGTVSTETCKSDLSYCISIDCNANGNMKCESACDSSVSPECDEQDPGMNVSVPGGVCNNCVFAQPCSWQNDNCGDSPCSFKERHQTCGPAGCVGDCDGQPPGSTRCIDEPACDCEKDCSCTCPTECPCSGGDTCPPGLLGGLVPCGRNCNDPCTWECECCPCTLCHLFVLFKRIVDFATLNVLFPLAVLMIVIGGVMFLTAAGDPGRIGTAKKILTSVVIGLLIIFLAWLIVDTIISFLTTGSPFEALFKQWNTIDCPIPGKGGGGGGGGPGCTCNDWVNDACGAAGCSPTEMHQTRTCNPVGCDVESQCIPEPACGAQPPPGCLLNPPNCLLCP